MQHPLIDMRTLSDSSSRILSTTQFQFTPYGPVSNPLSPLNPRVNPDASYESDKVSASAPVMPALAPKMANFGVGTRLDFSS